MMSAFVSLLDAVYARVHRAHDTVSLQGCACDGMYIVSNVPVWHLHTHACAGCYVKSHGCYIQYYDHIQWESRGLEVYIKSETQPLQCNVLHISLHTRERHVRLH